MSAVAPYTERNEQRLQSVLELCSTGVTILDAGARIGRHARHLVGRFQHIVALDLVKPNIVGCECVQGDITNLQYPDRHFEAVLCSEVLEHVPDVQRAASELARVTADRLIIGVPYKQDLRSGRYTCEHCGYTANAWDHLHSFDENRVLSLFPGWRADAIHRVGAYSWGQTNAVAALIMDWARNPYGCYDDPCGKCGRKMGRPQSNMLAKLANKLAQIHHTTPDTNWIHVLFRRSQV